MKESSIANRQEIARIKAELDCGRMTYADAIAAAAPIVDSVNMKARELAQKYGQRPRLVSAVALLR